MISGKSLLVRGLNVLAATISTPLAPSATVAARLRCGSALLRPRCRVVHHRGCRRRVPERVQRHDRGPDGRGVLQLGGRWTVRRAGAYSSVTAQLNTSVQAAIAAIPATAWTPIAYRRALGDVPAALLGLGREVKYTAFTGHPNPGQGGGSADCPADRVPLQNSSQVL
jgi:hypothetical protein